MQTRPIYGLMHFYNEELLIGEWLNHHLKFFDQIVLINHNSTDKSLEIVKSFNTDRILCLNTKLQDFNASQNDLEIQDIEQNFTPKDCWKLCLNTTEFLFTPNIKEKLEELENQFPDTMAFGMRSACIVDRLEDTEIKSPLCKYKTWGFMDIGSVRRWRYIHKSDHGHYQVGRHGVNLSAVNIPELLILHFSYSPYPQCKERKLQIQTKIPVSDKLAGLGKQHLIDDRQLDENRLNVLQYSYNLLNDSLFAEYYDKMEL